MMTYSRTRLSQVRRVQSKKNPKEVWEGYHFGIPAKALQKYTKAIKAVIAAEGGHTKSLL